MQIVSFLVKRKNINLSSAEFTHSAVSVKYTFETVSNISPTIN